jgi:hypothetical protein
MDRASPKQAERPDGDSLRLDLKTKAADVARTPAVFGF